MLLTARSRTRRTGSLVAAIGVVLALFVVASPAQAAPGVTLSVNDTAITLGDSVTLTWTGSGSTTLTAGGDWSGVKALPSGSETITPTETGSFTYSLVGHNANNPDDQDDTASVTVTVAPGPITPNAVTFPDPCTVVIPTTPNVTYFVDFGDGDTQELDADTYDGGELSSGDTVTFFAEANDGFTLADGATTRWDYTAPDSCFDIDEGPDLVTTTVTCGSVTFTNTTDGPIDVIYGSFEEEQPDGDFTLAAGASRTVRTKHADFAFIASPDADGEESPTQIRVLEVPQNCDGGSGSGGNGGSDNGNGNGSDHPTTAPAAGVAAL